MTVSTILFLALVTIAALYFIFRCLKPAQPKKRRIKKSKTESPVSSLPIPGGPEPEPKPPAAIEGEKRRIKKSKTESPVSSLPIPGGPEPEPKPPAAIEGGHEEESFQEQRKCDLMIRHCPLTAGKEDVMKTFPTATRVNFVKSDGQFVGMCFVRFATPEEAVAASKKRNVTIKNQAVTVHFASEMEEARQQEIKCQIVIHNCPWEVKEENIREIFPNAKHVHLLTKNRQFSGVCFVLFHTRKEAVAASQKTGLAIGGRLVRICLADETQKTAKNQRQYG